MSGVTHSGAFWCIVVNMPAKTNTVRQSVTISAKVAQRIKALAKARRTSQSRVLEDLIETGLEAKEREKRHYLDLLDQLRNTEDPSEQERLTAELARLTFGE
jgi:hypothetical protein